MTKNVLFLCPHSAAKSTMAAALLARKGIARGLELRVGNAGTDPDDEVNPIVARHLLEYGYPEGDPPRMVSAELLDWADVIVNIGCPREDLPASTAIQDWEIPDFSKGPPAAFAALEIHVDQLLESLDSEVRFE